MKKPTTKEVLEFLRESNAIEQVYDDDSLKQAKKAWDFLMTCPELTEANVLMVHRILSLNSKLKDHEKGFFRRVPVWVGGREGIDWTAIPYAINSWLKDVETSNAIPGEDGSHFKLDHITYERIHPFVDFNGRSGRIFLNWQRVKAGLPLLVIKADWPDADGEQKKYYLWFKQHD